jgi:transposase-like protein
MTRRTVEMLLNGDIKGLAKQAEELSRSLKVQMGDLCPECGSTNVMSNDGNYATEHLCADCDHRWGVDNGERYGF